MFLNTAPRTPFENRTNGTNRNSFKGRPDKEFKRDTRPRTWSIKDTPKKSDEMNSQQKNVLKDFMKSLKDLENEGLKTVLYYLHDNIYVLPCSIHWQVFMELADLAKRENRIEDARKLLEISVKLQPSAHQAWLEYSKLEEECGRMQLAHKYLMLGLHFSPFSDQLAIKFIKIEEKIGDISVSRRILGSLSGGTIEKNWKILLEGGLMEARNGKIDLARHILQSLVYHCGSFGAVYLEAIKFEEKWGTNLQFALDLCEKGLNRNQRYGPLWFSTLRVLEKLHSHGSNSAEIRKKQESLLSDAEQYLSKELLWKLYLDYALFLDKKNRLQDSRRYLKESVISAPENLRWKAWIAGSRVELHAGNSDVAFKLLQNSLDEVPSKQKPLVLVEISQAHELLNNIPKAREFMTQACEKSKQDWKIYLERINLEMRCGCFVKGLEIAKEAVSKYFSTGRLWASLIQLFHSDKQSISKNLHFKAFLLAIQEVPKSGEVWCEGARLRMNPFTKYYDLDKAEEYLNYAIQFTPQYGDSFIEMLRVYMLKGELHKFHDLKRICINADPNYGMLWFYCKNSPLEGARDVWKRAKSMMVNEMCRMKGLYENPRCQEEWVELMWTGLCEAIWSFTRNGTLDFNSRAKLIYGSEGLIL